MPIDFNKPVETKNGDKVRILCIDAEGVFPIIGVVNGVVVRWNTAGFSEINEACDEDPLSLNNPPPLEKFYVNISEDGSYQSEIQGLTYTPTTMAQLIVDPENKTIRIQGFNETTVSVIGEEKSKPGVRQAPAREGDLMGGYFRSLNGRQSSIDLKGVEIVDAENEE